MLPGSCVHETCIDQIKEYICNGNAGYIGKNCSTCNLKYFDNSLYYQII